MPRDCSHMPGAAKDVDCPLCKDLKRHGKVVTGSANIVLNQQPGPKPKGRVCPRCNAKVTFLVSRGAEHICAACAESLDEDA